jgi:hypothetical protein
MLDFVKAFHDAFRGATWLFFVLMFVGFGCVGLLFAWIVHSTIEKREADESQLTVEWHRISPAPIPPQGNIPVLELFERANGTEGLDERGGTPGADLSRIGEVLRDVWQYRITNYSPKPMFNIKIPLHLVFTEAVTRSDLPNAKFTGKVVTDRQWEITIPKIDPGGDKPFVFYAINEGNCFVKVSFPNTATAQLAGTNSRETVQVIFPGLDWISLPPNPLHQDARTPSGQQ